MDFSKARWRKATDVDRENAHFELLHDDVILLDVAFSDDEVFEIVFNEGISNTIVGWDSFVGLVNNGRKLAEADKRPL